MKETIKEFYIKEFIKELQKRMEELQFFLFFGLFIGVLFFLVRLEKMASLNENLKAEQVTNLVFQCAKKAARSKSDGRKK